MWEQSSEFVATYLDPIGVVLGLVVTIPIFATWYEVTIGRHRRHRRWFHEMRERPGQVPAILILDLLDGKDVRTSVERFRQTQPDLKDIPADRIFRIARDKKLVPNDLPKLHSELRGLAATILLSGTDTLHYFHAGPACIAALVGAEFSNAVRVLLYQHNPHTGSYENFGPLRAP